ncbi:MAG: TatD family hydrolase [Planctomycetota bacterium]|nr:TatD family hydrolase [Planctomycetota bacterium]MDG1982937.1 TatD family hydrolase [Planctomycetota bacterium]
MRLIDIGVNLMSRQFEGDRDEVLRRARQVNVERMILTGTDLRSSEAAAEASRREGQGVELWSTAGVHPHHASEFDDATAARLRELHRDERVVAVGECGLDYNRNFSPREAQLSAFENQLGLAAEAGLPVFLHQRDAHDEFLAVLRNAWPSLPRGAVVHCFTEGPEAAADYLELGCHLGITGWVCDERRGGDLRQAVAEIPADRLLLETDAPYLLPRNLDPKPASRRNEPRHLPAVLAAVAALRGETPGAVAAAAWEASQALFGLEPA